MLIEAGANPNSQMLKELTTPLYSAAIGGRVEAVEMLLQAKADPLLGRGSKVGSRWTWRRKTGTRRWCGSWDSVLGSEVAVVRVAASRLLRSPPRRGM